MIPLGCAPAGLKYLNRAPFHFSASCNFPALIALFRSALMKSVIAVSTTNLVFPYGLVGPRGHSSGIGIILGNRVASPYTVAELEKTMLVTLCRFIARRRHIDP